MKIISYGISKNYLQHWGINEALREVFQNYIDYGEYDITEKVDTNTSTVYITLSNNYEPENLEFLAIGNSKKESSNARGKYGEGLKMAMLIFKRENLFFNIQTKGKNYFPVMEQTLIGETLGIGITTDHNNYGGFNISFALNLDDWIEYQSKLIKKEDIIFTHSEYGSIVDKPKGDIYCGGLFVRNVNNLSAAYDIKPKHLALDRDRSMPSTFDVNWATSLIKEAYGKTKIEDLTYSDTEYITTLPSEVKKQIRPRLVGNSIEPTYKHKGQTVVIKNSKVKEIMNKDSFFTKTIKRLKMFLMKQLGLYDMLIEFEKNHVHSQKAKEDFKIILMKVENNE